MKGGDSGACAYVVTAHKSTAVTHTVVGNFTSPTDLNLIVGKHTRIEGSFQMMFCKKTRQLEFWKTEMNLYKVNKSSDIGLEPVREFNLYGKIQVLLLFRYKVSFISTSSININVTPKSKIWIGTQNKIYHLEWDQRLSLCFDWPLLCMYLGIQWW